MLFYTKYALEKIDGLGINKSEIESAINKGMKWKEKDSEKWHAQMAGVEVVFMKEENNFFVITVYYEGGGK